MLHTNQLLQVSVYLFQFHLLSLLLLQIYSGGQLQNFIDGYDVHSSNWMRYVNPARSLAEQNLVACQNSRDIYFYTIRPVEPNQELLVWYSQEFAQRLCSQQVDNKQSECSRNRSFSSFVSGCVSLFHRRDKSRPPNILRHREKQSLCMQTLVVVINVMEVGSVVRTQPKQLSCLVNLIPP